jgi:CheY-like chemotaxis protein
LQTATPEETPRLASSAAVRGKTILVVEDHEDTRRVLSRALRRRGFGVTAAGSVSAAAEQFTSSPADLIICDIGLPDGSGWDLMERLRPHGPVRAIAVSGFGMEHDVKKSREVGFLAHLTKRSTNGSRSAETLAASFRRGTAVRHLQGKCAGVAFHPASGVSVQVSL